MTHKDMMTVAAEFVVQGRKLFGERVMVIVDEGEETVGSLGLLHMPGGEKLRKQSGVIVMVGVDVDLEKHDVKVGDRILFTRYQPTEGELERLDGSEVSVAMMHIADLYVGTNDTELRLYFEDECARLWATIE